MKLFYSIFAVWLGYAGLALASEVTTNTDKISITQFGKTFFLSNDIYHPTEITLKPRDMIIQTGVINANTAIQICASDNSATLAAIQDKTLNGQSQCFASGTGLAMPLTDNPKLGMPFYISSGKGHNYYSADRRVNSSKDTSIYINQVEHIHSFVLSKSDIIVFIDKNQDDVAQKGELWAARINWLTE